MKWNLKTTPLYFLFMFLLPMHIQAQWYAGASYGETNVETERVDQQDFTITPAFIIWEDSDTANKAFVGWRATPALAIEFGYADLGKYTWRSENPSFQEGTVFEPTAAFGEFVAQFDLGSGWYFLAKLGLAYWDAEVTYQNSNGGFTDKGSKSDVDPLLGLGFEYRPPRSSIPLYYRFEWEQFQNVGEGLSYLVDTPAEVEELNGQDINVLSITFIYDFDVSH